MPSFLRYRHCLLWLLLLVSETAFAQAPQVDTALRYVGMRETLGSNRSPVIDAWNRALGVPLGSPYCATGLSYWLTAANVRVPSMRSARARSFVTSKAIDASRVLRGEVRILRGDIIIWKRSQGGHIGVAESDWTGARGRAVEANTSSGRIGSQWNGDGIWIRDRRITPLSSFRITHIIKVTP